MIWFLEFFKQRETVISWVTNKSRFSSDLFLKNCFCNLLLLVALWLWRELGFSETILSCSEHVYSYFLSIKVGLSHPKKILCYLLHWKPLKNHEKCFLFHLKSSFRFQDISVFVMTFWSCRKKGLIRKVKLTSKFMTFRPG